MHVSHAFWQAFSQLNVLLILSPCLSQPPSPSDMLF